MRMRKVLFRGKDKDNKQWYEGSYVLLSDTTYCFATDYENARKEGRDPEHHYILFDQMTDWGLPNQHFKVEVMPETVCECSGIGDANHKFIYERDILRITNTYLGVDVGELYLVEYRKGSFCVSQGGMYTPLSGFSQYCKMEVVGNAIDDPDLLKQIPCYTPEGFFEKLEKEVKGYA